MTAKHAGMSKGYSDFFRIKWMAVDLRIYNMQGVVKKIRDICLVRGESIGMK